MIENIRMNFPITGLTTTYLLYAMVRWINIILCLTLCKLRKLSWPFKHLSIWKWMNFKDDVQYVIPMAICDINGNMWYQRQWECAISILMVLAMCDISSNIFVPNNITSYVSWEIQFSWPLYSQYIRNMKKLQGGVDSQKPYLSMDKFHSNTRHKRQPVLFFVY